MSLYAAFNTLQSELERLLVQRESITRCLTKDNNYRRTELEQLDNNILSHEQGLKLIIATHLKQQNVTVLHMG